MCSQVDLNSWKVPVRHKACLISMLCVFPLFPQVFHRERILFCLNRDKYRWVMQLHSSTFGTKSVEVRFIECQQSIANVNTCLFQSSYVLFLTASTTLISEYVECFDFPTPHFLKSRYTFNCTRFLEWIRCQPMHFLT